MSKKLYLASPYGFSPQQEERLLTLVDILAELGRTFGSLSHVNGLLLPIGRRGSLAGHSRRPIADRHGRMTRAVGSLKIGCYDRG